MSKRFYTGLGKTAVWPLLPDSFPPVTSFTYDDVLVMPGIQTKINSRRAVDISVDFGPFKLKVPIISAPMDTVTGEKMIRTLASLGAIGTLPRLINFDETVAYCEQFSKEKIPCVYALNLKDSLNQAKQLEKKGARMILIDVAHGGMEQVVEAASAIKRGTDLYVMAGNIVSYEQAKLYKRKGVDIARVGVGPGGACTTRLVTGVGFPQLSAVLETTSTGIAVVADGGIRKPGDVAKALAAGAAMVMIGSMFAGTEETPGEVINGMKELRGQASESYMKDLGLEVDGFRAAEGIRTEVVVKGSVKHIVNEITGGLRSAMSYVGAHDLIEFRKLAVFNVISSSTYSENQPHAATSFE